MSRISTAILQTPVSASKQENLDRVAELLSRNFFQDVDLVTLPEMFTCPYETTEFPKYAEPAGGPTWKFLSDLAAEHKVYLQAGSFPEIDDAGHIYNTAYVFDRDGKQIARHRKVHLFDIDITGEQTFRESDTLTAGDDVTVFDTEFGKMGLCICFDIRFQRLFEDMTDAGAKVVLVPASFNMTTGPAHWQLLFRSRALDNQIYVVGTSAARNLDASYVSYGHSLAVDPWGIVLSEMHGKAEGRVVDLDLDRVEEVRLQIPLGK